MQLLRALQSPQQLKLQTGMQSTDPILAAGLGMPAGDYQPTDLPSARAGDRGLLLLKDGSMAAPGADGLLLLRLKVWRLPKLMGCCYFGCKYGGAPGP